MVPSHVQGMIRHRTVESRTIVVAATLLRQSIKDCGKGIEAPHYYCSGKRVWPVEIVFFPETTTSGGPGEDVGITPS